MNLHKNLFTWSNDNRTTNKYFSSNGHFTIYHFRRKKKTKNILSDKFFFTVSSSLGVHSVFFNVQPLPSRDYTWLKSIASFLPGCCRTRFSTNQNFLYARAEIFCYCLQCGKGYFLAMVGVLCGFQKWTENI